MPLFPHRTKAEFRDTAFKCLGMAAGAEKRRDPESATYWRWAASRWFSLAA